MPKGRERKGMPREEWMNGIRGMIKIDLTEADILQTEQISSERRYQVLYRSFQ
jgi:hypothetical protein